MAGQHWDVYCEINMSTDYSRGLKMFCLSLSHRPGKQTVQQPPTSEAVTAYNVLSSIVLSVEF